MNPRHKGRYRSDLPRLKECAATTRAQGGDEELNHARRNKLAEAVNWQTVRFLPTYANRMENAFIASNVSGGAET